MTKALPAPRGLAAAGRKLWRQIAADVADADLELTPVEQNWLSSAAVLADQAALVQAELAGAPLMVRGSMGQQVANPLLGELRQLHLAIGLTLARIKVEPAESAGIVAGINQQRAAASSRHRGV